MVLKNRNTFNADTYDNFFKERDYRGAANYLRQFDWEDDKFDAYSDILSLEEEANKWDGIYNTATTEQRELLEFYDWMNGAELNPENNTVLKKFINNINAFGAEGINLFGDDGNNPNGDNYQKHDSGTAIGIRFEGKKGVNTAGWFWTKGKEEDRELSAFESFLAQNNYTEQDLKSMNITVKHMKDANGEKTSDIMYIPKSELRAIANILPALSKVTTGEVGEGEIRYKIGAFNEQVNSDGTITYKPLTRGENVNSGWWTSSERTDNEGTPWINPQYVDNMRNVIGDYFNLEGLKGDGAQRNIAKYFYDLSNSYNPNILEEEKAKTIEKSMTPIVFDTPSARAWKYQSDVYNKIPNSKEARDQAIEEVYEALKGNWSDHVVYASDYMNDNKPGMTLADQETIQKYMEMIRQGLSKKEYQEAISVKEAILGDKIGTYVTISNIPSSHDDKWAMEGKDKNSKTLFIEGLMQNSDEEAFANRTEIQAILAMNRAKLYGNSIDVPREDLQGYDKIFNVRTDPESNSTIANVREPDGTLRQIGQSEIESLLNKKYILDGLTYNLNQEFTSDRKYGRNYSYDSQTAKDKVKPYTSAALREIDPELYAKYNQAKSLKDEELTKYYENLLIFRESQLSDYIRAVMFNMNKTRR